MMESSQLIHVLRLVFSLLGAIGGLITIWSTGPWFRRQISRFWPRNRDSPPAPPADLTNLDHSEPAGETARQRIQKELQSVRDQIRMMELLERTLMQSVSVGQEDPANVV